MKGSVILASKKDVVLVMSEIGGISKAEAGRRFDLVFKAFNLILDDLAKNPPDKEGCRGKIVIPRFGTFRVKDMMNRSRKENKTEKVTRLKFYGHKKFGEE